MSLGRIAGLAPRFAAWRILHDVRHGVPFDVALERAITDLEPDDRRLAHELAAGVFRNRGHLDGRLAPMVEKGLDSVRPDTLDVLRLGAFQLLFLDRVPAHAAVQTTVGVARRLGGRRVAGFVNAVLRRVSDPATRIEVDSTTTGLAADSSHPEWLVERWSRRFGTDRTRALLEVNNRRPRLVVQPHGITIEALESMFRDAGVGSERAPWDAGLIVGTSRPTELPGFEKGIHFVQDPAQRMVTRYLAPEPGSTIYDACAAPGGKTLALAQSARIVIAADNQLNRVKRLAANIARTRERRAAPIVALATEPPVEAVDVVLLDVPCLGTGTLSRNPDLRWRATPEALDRLVAQAATFLAAAADVVRPGGLLLFATCSLEPEENEVQIDRFLSGDRRFRREPTDSVPSDLLSAEGDLAILPTHAGTDGAYAARLRKVAS